MNYKDLSNKLYLKYLIIILVNVSIHTYFFISAALFSDKYISERYLNKWSNKGFEIIYILTNEIERIYLTLYFSFIITRLLRWILYGNSLDNIDNLIQDGFK